MGFYRLTDIEKEVTALTTQYLNNGYWILFSKRVMYSRAKGHVWLTNGNENVRILINEDYVKEHYTNDYGDYRLHRTIEVVVERFKPREYDIMSDGELLESKIYKTFYQLKSEYQKELYTDVFDGFFECKEKQRDRQMKYVGTVKNLNNYDMDKVMRILKNHSGYKRVKREDVISVTRHTYKELNEYVIYIKGKSALCISFK